MISLRPTDRLPLPGSTGIVNLDAKEQAGGEGSQMRPIKRGIELSRRRSSEEASWVWIAPTPVVYHGIDHSTGMFFLDFWDWSLLRFLRIRPLSRTCSASIFTPLDSEVVRML